MPQQPVNYNAIKTALFTRLVSATFTQPINGLSTWGFTSRRLRLFNAIDDSRKPSMCMVQHRERYINPGKGTPPKRYLEMGAWVNIATGDPDGTIIGDDLLDLCTAAIEAVLQPDNPQGNELTLGGLVYWCKITRDDNMYIRDPGDIDGQGLLVLPIQILIP